MPKKIAKKPAKKTTAIKKVSKTEIDKILMQRYGKLNVAPTLRARIEKRIAKGDKKWLKE